MKASDKKPERLHKPKVQPDRFQFLYATMPLGVVFQDANGQVIDANSAAERILGLTLDQMRGRTSIDPRWRSIHEDGSDFPGETHPAMISLRTGKPVSNVVMGVFNPAANLYRWININSVPCFAPGSETPHEVYTTFEDITGRKQTEETLKKFDERFRRNFDDMLEGCMVIGFDWRYIYLNEAAARQGRQERETLLGRTMAEAYPGVENSAVFAHYCKCMEERVPQHFVSSFTFDDGAINWYEFSVQPAVEGIFVLSIDITERKRAEARILHVNRLYATISHINQTIVRAQDRDTLFSEVCRVAIEHGGFRMAWIGMVDEKDEFITPIVFAGEEQGYLKDAKIAVRDSIQGGGPTGTAIREGRCVICQDIANDPRMALWREQALQRGYRSSAAVPILQRNRPIGALSVYAADPHGFSDDDRILLDEIGSDISYALDSMDTEIERRHAEQQTQIQLQRISALNEIDRAISSSLDMRISLDILLNAVLTQLGVDAASVLLMMPDQTLEYVAGRGYRSPAIRQSRMRIGEGLAGRVGLERKRLHIPDLAREGEQYVRADLLNDEKFFEYVGIPLVAKGMLKGVLEIFHRSHLNPSAEWMNYLETLGGQAAIAIDTAQLFERLQQTNQDLVAAYDATIEGWSLALDLRDRETQGHTQRVTALTEQLARRMGIGAQDLIHLRRGALLHDIGKLGVPDHILLKRGELTEEERSIMRQHPVYAFEMLMPIAYLRPALDIPYCHHERWDGSGYPRGLKNVQIPLAARLFTIVDVWDALRSDRPYRARWPVEEVRTYIREQSGRHFDPGVVGMFLSMTREFPG